MIHSSTCFRLLAAALLLDGWSGTNAALPLLPRGDNSENIVFQDDFSNGNLKGWSNIGSGPDAATIGPGPEKEGIWYPGSDGGHDATSSITLPVALNLADGAVAVYMRVRSADGKSPNKNVFRIAVAENSPGSGSLTIGPANQTTIGYLSSTGAAQPPAPNGLRLPAGLATYQDFRLVFTRTSGDLPGDSLKLEAFYYDTKSETYQPLGSIAGAHISTGIFNRLELFSTGGAGQAACDSVMLTQLGSPRATSPGNACRLPFPLPDGVTIQSALDANSTVVLDRGDYSAREPFTLKTGQKLYGDPAGTVIPAVTIEPGAKGVVLSTFTVGGAVTFPAATTAITSGCVFERLSCGVNVDGGILEDNLFLHLSAGIHINTAASGHARNNRFIRCKLQAAWPQLVLLGDEKRNSYGNVFVWYNFLTPHGTATDIKNQGDLTVVGVDAETWNEKGLGTDALWKVGRMGTLRIFGMNGGNHGDNKTGDFDVDADEFQLFNDSMEKIEEPLVDYHLGANNLRSLLINSSVPGKVWSNAATDPFRMKAFAAGATDVSISTSSDSTPVWQECDGPLPAANPDQQAILRGMVVNPSRPAGQVPWEAPHHGPIPDPAGPNWETDLANQPDSASYIQRLIDTKRIARLPAGVYYISAPLKLARRQGIIGAGADSTVIIAKAGTIDMIMGNDPVKTQTGTQIILADLTLQGGANGIHFEAVGTSANQGRYAQYTDSFISHVTFRNMTNAGIFMDQIYALDNNFFSYLNFVNCDTGLKQKVDPSYAGGENPTMMYMDKCVFYKSQFVGNRLAMDLPGQRSCNLNSWISCLFQNNSEGAAAMNSYLTAVFANCDFINNGGNAVVSNNSTVSHVSNRFVAGENGSAMLGGPVSAEGCSFDAGGSTAATILGSTCKRVFLINCSSKNMPLGLPADADGMLVNTALGMDAQLNQQVISLKNAEPTVILPGAPAPTPQLLFGSDWSAVAWPTKNY